MTKIRLIFLLILTVSLASGWAQVDSQWRGPNRDGVYPGEKLLDAWPEAGPKQVLLIEGIGDGYSSPSVTGDRIYVTGLTKGNGFLYAFDQSGKQIWASSYGREWSGSRPGARTTPTIVGDRIYLMSAMGGAVCLDTEGRTVWSVDLKKEFGAKNIEWGMTESPLVAGDRVIFTPGGRKALVVALDRTTGKTVWIQEGNGETSGYCSPCLVVHGGRELLITMTARSVIGLDPETGKLLWRHSHVTDYDVNANTPLYDSGFLYTNSGYGTGGQMFELSADGTDIEKIWSNNKMDSQMGGFVLVDGYIYGSGHNHRGWHCLDWKTGDVKFSSRALGGKGAVILADGKLYLYSERGDVGLAKPDPEGLEIISSFRVREGSGEHWAHPVIESGRLFIRHGDALMAYHIGN